MSPATVNDAVRYLMEAQSAALPKNNRRPSSNEVVTALALAEKQSKRAKQRYDYAQLTGAWQLGFVSGTRQVRPSRKGAKPLKQLGKGRFLPRWIDLSITYGSPKALLPSKLLNRADLEDGNIGAVVNRVGLGGVSLQLSGPTRYWPKTNTLGFDFVYLQGEVGPMTLYNAPVRGGVARANSFADVPLKEQAFFTFFAVEPSHIAARGKGGGLALWTRLPAS